MRRECGKDYAAAVKNARDLIRKGKADEPRADLRGFSPRRFLSLALPESVEAKLFDYDGPLRHFSSLRLPVLAFFGSREGYACRAVFEMGEILGERSRSEHFEYFTISGGDHSFRGLEPLTARRAFDWLKTVLP